MNPEESKECLEHRKKYEEFELTKAILAHSILEQIAEVKNINYSGAFAILEHAKFVLERCMKDRKPEIKPEILDRWGKKIEMPGTEAPGNKEN